MRFVSRRIKPAVIGLRFSTSRVCSAPSGEEAIVTLPIKTDGAVALVGGIFGDSGLTLPPASPHNR